MINDSDLKSGETWKDYVNKDSFLVTESNSENEEESKHVNNTSAILNKVLDLENNNIEGIID